MISEEKIRELSASINKIRKEYVDYLAIYKCSNMLLEEVFGKDTDTKFSDSDNELVDIERIIKELGILSERQPLPRHGKYTVIAHLLRGINRAENKARTPTILVSDECKISKSKIAIAKMIFSYLKDYDNIRSTGEVRLMIFEYEKVEGIIADTFARLLLLPPKLVQKEFKIWENNNELEFADVDEWHKYLEWLAVVPLEDAVIGWQEDRIVLKLLEKSEL